MIRPDFSEYLVHFTKNASPSSANYGASVAEVVAMRAIERLSNILRERKVRAHRIPFTKQPAACFTECTWPALFVHAAQYSRYGIGFSKRTVFRAGGSPVFYIPPHAFEAQVNFVEGTPYAPELWALLAPFRPSYASAEYMNEHYDEGRVVDFSHEREWRVPQDFEFELTDVEFVIVDSHEDMNRIPDDIRSHIPADRWVFMANYEKVERLWPR